MSHISVDTVAAKIVRDNPEQSFDIHYVAEWCFEVVNHIGSFDSYLLTLNEEIPVINKRALLPCGLVRLLDVSASKHGFGVLNYYNDGTYINFNDLVRTSGGLPKTVVIDYEGLRSDDKGWPLLQNDAKEAAYWYCIKKLKFPDYLSGTINDRQYAYIEDRYNHYVDVARGSAIMRMSRNDSEELMRIAYSMIKPVTHPKDLT